MILHGKKANLVLKPIEDYLRPFSLREITVPAPISNPYSSLTMSL
jgi:hypothetical protein